MEAVNYVLFSRNRFKESVERFAGYMGLLRASTPAATFQSWLFMPVSRTRLRNIVVALDLGTSQIGAMALATDLDTPLAIISRPNNAELPKQQRGRHEQSPELLLGMSLDLLGALLNQPGVDKECVTAIALTGQMHGLLLVDPANMPLTPLITWLDRRTLDEGPGSLGASKKSLPVDAAKSAGCDLHPGYGGATLAWLAARNLLPEDCRALSISDYIAAALSGAHCTDATHAASWGLIDVETLSWNGPILNALGIPRAVLPEIRPSGAPLGRISEAMATRFGLPASVMVHVPMGDNQAGVIGATGIRDDRAVISLGTGGQVSVPRRTPHYVPGLETRPMPPLGYLAVGAILCGGLATACVCRFFRETIKAFTGHEIPEADAYKCLDGLVASSAHNGDGLEADTRFAGTRGNPYIRGAITGISLDNFTPGNLARAVLEGTVRELAKLARLAGLEGASGLVASGAAAHNNPALLDIIQREFRLPCRLSGQSREAALGAARLVAAQQRQTQ